jgi:hypothetical protein
MLFEIDEKGNYFVQLADAATEGYELNIPAGNYVKTVEKDEIVSIIGDSGHSVGKNGNFIYGENYTLSTGKDLLIQSEQGSAALNFVSTVGREQAVLKSKTHLLVLDDTSGSESVFIFHKTGSQIVLDQQGSAKIITKSGNAAILDDPSGTITLTSKTGAFVSLADTITITDKSGAQFITLDATDTIQVVSKSDVIVNSPSISLKGGSINLGDLATFSAVIAEPLALLFDTHIHGSALGPTSPPLPPNTAAIVNLNPATAFAHSFIKIRGNLG